MASFIRLGGIHWTPGWIGWGQVGRPRADGSSGRKEILGYSAKKSTSGRMSDEERQRRIVNVWHCRAVYALFNQGEVVYIGEGKLGDRLEKHWKQDILVGRWDSFSWLSPDVYSIPEMGDAAIAITEDALETTASAKELVELLELVAIRLGAPPANSQLPSNDKEIIWLTQVRSETSILPIEDKLDLLLQKIEEIKNQQEGAANGAPADAPANL